MGVMTIRNMERSRYGLITTMTLLNYEVGDSFAASPRTIVNASIFTNRLIPKAVVVLSNESVYTAAWSNVILVMNISRMGLNSSGIEEAFEKHYRKFKLSEESAKTDRQEMLARILSVLKDANDVSYIRRLMKDKSEKRQFR